MKRARSKLTYSNVVSTLCLFLLLGGGAAFAAKTMLPKNSVGTKQLKNEAVTAAKIKNGSITGGKIDLSSLGTVPSATSANTANTANSATNASNATHAMNATSATSAANADALGGSPPSAFEAASDLLGAVVSNNGTATFERGTAGTTVERVSPGDVFVEFPRDVTECTWVTSVGNPGATPLFAGLAGARGANNGNPDTVQIITWNTAGTQTDMDFHLIVLC
jgi:hypothetical protein